MFLLGMRDSGTGIYLQQLVIGRNLPLDAGQLKRAFDALVARHAALRCSFFFDDAARIALRHHDRASVPFISEDLSALAGCDQEKRLEAFLKEDRAKGFGPDDTPLMRVAVFRLGENQHRIVWTSHHAIMDGRSRVIALQELFALEAAFLNNRSPTLAPSPDYASYHGWLQSQRPFRSRAFWKSQLDGMVEPSKLPLPVSTAPKSWGMCVLELDEELTARLRRCSEQAGVTLNTLLQAAWAIFLSRHSGSEDVLFGATRACRHLEGLDVQRMVGLLINTVPIRVKPCRNLLLGDFLRSLHQLWIAIRDHEHTPLESIHEWCGFNAASTLFHSIVVFERGALHDLVSPDDASWDCELLQRTGVPITLSAFDGKSLRMELHYDGERYGVEDAAHFLALLKQLFISMIDGADQPIGELSMLSHAERERVVVEWNQTSTDFPSHARAEELFEEQAKRTPGAAALIHNGRRISYESLNSLADALCDRLIAEGLETGGRVAVAMERSPELVIAMLAILKAGCAYVPMEMNAPGSRARAILRQVRPQFLLLHGAENIPWIKESAGLKVIDLATNSGVAEPLPQGNFTGRVHEAAYVMFTSGSTGVPKGVVVPHRAIVRLVKDTNYCKISATDVIGHLSNPAFDASTFEVWGPLLNGGAVSIIDSEVALSPTELRGKIATDRITALWLTTALFNEFACEQPDTFRNLRYLLTGGEKVSPTAFAAVAQACPELQLLNGYGPTEATTFATTFLYNSNQPMGESIPIGRPIANTTIYLLDERGEPVPLGVPGEIHIGGPGVAIGYFDDPELTKQRFLPDPFDPRPNRLLYRSGDLGRLLLDGNIEFLGRADQQIKLRGFRIEPAEIENALTALEEISASAVLGRFEQGTCVGLSAFVTLHRPAAACEDQKIAARLTASLPSYMVPDCITILDRLPVNANGKVDRAALAKLAVNAAPTKPAVDFKLTKTQSVLMDIWRELLERDQIGLDDNFFTLGGHSLRAVRCLLQVHRNLGVSLPMITLFESPTIRELAEQIETATTPQSDLSSVTADQSAPDEARPTTPAEQRFLDYLSNRPNPEDMIISRGFRFRGPLRTDLLEQSFALVVRRHAPLRTKFIPEPGRTMARPMPSSDFPLPLLDLTHLKPAEQEALGQEALLENSRQLFNLATDLPLRVRMLKFSAEDHLLLLALHHIVADGWSLDLLRRDLLKAYRALLEGQTDPLPPLPITFGMIAEQERNRAPEAFNHRIAIWQQRLTLPLPSIDTLFRKQPAQVDPSEAPFPAVTMLLSAEQTRAIDNLARSHQTSIFLLLLSVYKLLLSRLTGNPDVIVGTAVAGRIAPGSADVIGTFAQNRPLRTDLAGCTRFDQILERVGTTMRGALEDEELPFGSIAALVPPRVPPQSNPIFDAYYCHYSDDPEANQSPPGLSIVVLENPIRHTKVPLNFNSFLRGERLELMLCAVAKFFSQEQIERLRDQFVFLQQQILEKPDRRLEEYSLVSPLQKSLLPDPSLRL